MEMNLTCQTIQHADTSSEALDGALTAVSGKGPQKNQLHYPPPYL